MSHGRVSEERIGTDAIRCGARSMTQVVRDNLIVVPRRMCESTAAVTVAKSLDIRRARPKIHPFIGTDRGLLRSIFGPSNHV